MIQNLCIMGGLPRLMHHSYIENVLDQDSLFLGEVHPTL